ncbi:pyruvate dehydrogenase E1 component subunit alpha-1, mitochondrial-like [Typha angustifolia]|uniref:pyruvate dehydrogenase E1 component subunit alpha-1, mitochondrial-like n=1 Tax=Typha angustifolia TaxID=59011 RepID=UPI003C2B1922
MVLLRRLSFSSTSSIRFLSITSHGFSYTSSNKTLMIEMSIPFTSNWINPPSHSVDMTSSMFLSFRTMSTMHRMQIVADFLYKAKLIHGFCHLYDSQETAITKFDAIITAYHDHYIYLNHDGDLVSVFDKLMGHRNGCSKGKGGSMHFYKKDANFYGGHEIVGGRFP